MRDGGNADVTIRIITSPDILDELARWSVARLVAKKRE